MLPVVLKSVNVLEVIKMRAEDLRATSESSAHSIM